MPAPRGSAASPESATVVDLLAAIVRGERVAAARFQAFPPELLCQQAVHHGVLPLVTERLVGVSDVPARLLLLLQEGRTAAVVADMAREDELRRLLVRLDEASVGALLIKGAQLAYTYYPRADLRPRVDSDLLIPASMRTVAHDVLLELGYEGAGQMSGDLVAYQAFYQKRREAASVHAVDLHWRVANPQMFASVLMYDELAAHAVPILRLSPAARGLTLVHALLLACTHRVAHHYDSDALIWLYDIALLARDMRREEWERFVELAAERKVVAVCRRSLEQAEKRFDASVPAWVWRDARFVAARDGELSAGYLSSRRHVSVIADDVRALATWSERWHLLREHFFPPAQYMRTVYAPASRLPLPLLYARRLIRGTQKWMLRR